MGILLMIHSILRWLLVIAALVAVAHYALGLAQSRPFGRTATSLWMAFSGMMDLQALLGIILLVWGGLAGIGFPMYRLEHAVTLLAAAGITHLSARWKKLGDRKRYRNHLLLLIGVLALVYVGVSVLPGNRWTF